MGMEGAGEGPDAGIGTVEQEITGGSLTTAAPWIVRVDLPGGSLCSGSVLSEHWVLTAAHCVDGKGSSGMVTIRYASSLGAATSVYSGNAYFYKHPHYQPGWFWPDREDDVALIRLASGAGINLSLTGRAALWGYTKPWTSSSSSERDFRMIGWGLTDPSGGDDCVSGSGVKRLGLGFRVKKTGVTATTVEAPIGAVHACGGDSGTPWTFVRGGRYIAFAVHSGRVPDFIVAGDEHQAPLLPPKYGWIYERSKSSGLMLDCKSAGYSGGVPYLECEERVYAPEPPPPIPGSSCPSGKYCCEPAPVGDTCSLCVPVGTYCP